MMLNEARHSEYLGALRPKGELLAGEVFVLYWCLLSTRKKNLYVFILHIVCN